MVQHEFAKRANRVELPIPPQFEWDAVTRGL